MVYHINKCINKREDHIMKVSEIMTKDVISLSVDDTAQHAAELMK